MSYILSYNRDAHGNDRSIVHNNGARRRVPINDPVFHNYMLHCIKTRWIPYVENLEEANGRKAYWHKIKRVILFEENEVSESE
jgi:hypothetical protein